MHVLNGGIYLFAVVVKDLCALSNTSDWCKIYTD